jgi:hypothetical protein
MKELSVRALNFNISGVMRPSKVRYVGKVSRMGDTRNAYSIFVGDAEVNMSR